MDGRKDGWVSGQVDEEVESFRAGNGWVARSVDR